MIGQERAIPLEDQYRKRYWQREVRATALELLPIARAFCCIRRGTPTQARETRASTNHFAWQGLPFEIQLVIWQYVEPYDTLSPRQLRLILEYGTLPPSLSPSRTLLPNKHVDLMKRIWRECEIAEWLMRVGCEWCETKSAKDGPSPPLTYALPWKAPR